MTRPTLNAVSARWCWKLGYQSIALTRGEAVKACPFRADTVHAAWFLTGWSGEPFTEEAS